VFVSSWIRASIEIDSIPLAYDDGYDDGYETGVRVTRYPSPVTRIRASARRRIRRTKRRRLDSRLGGRPTRLVRRYAPDSVSKVYLVWVNSMKSLVTVIPMDLRRDRLTDAFARFRSFRPPTVITALTRSSSVKSRKTSPVTARLSSNTRAGPCSALPASSPSKSPVTATG